MAVSKKRTDELADIKEVLNEINNTETVEGDKEPIPKNSIELTHAVIESLFDENKLKMITNLDSKELKGISKLFMIDKIMFRKSKCALLTDFINNFLALKISLKGMGRTDLLKAIANVQDEDEIKTGFKRFL
jgi:hypothetical protein